MRIKRSPDARKDKAIEASCDEQQGLSLCKEDKPKDAETSPFEACSNSHR